MAQLLGALIPTFLISRLFLWLSKKRPEAVPRLLVVHLASFAVCFVLAGLGYANDGQFAWQMALGGYLIPQMIWLIFDLAMLAKKRKTAPQP
jgi:hypothetical protein